MSNKKKPTDEDIVMTLCKQKQFLLEEQERTGNTPDTQLVYVTGEAVFEILDLIHHLQSENENLKAEKQLAFDTVKGYSLTDIEQKAEIEQLTEENGQLKSYNNGLEYENSELQKQVDELKEELEKAYITERANIQAEIAEAGTSCHWCEQQTVKDTTKEILTELDLFFNGTTFRKGYEFKKINEKLKEIAKRNGMEVK